MRRRTWLAAVGLWALAPLGCGDRKPALAAVRGTVYYRGAPLSGGSIVFTPDPERGGRGPLAFGRIKPDGTYTLATGTQPGAVPGWHRVTVKAFPPPDGAPPSADPLPAKYSDPEQSGLGREVKAGDANLFDFHLD
jgi:hypothetical protein